MGALYQGFPGVRGVFVPTDQSQFLIYPHFVDVSGVDYYTHIPNHADKTKGLALSLSPVTGDAGSTVRVILDVTESAMRPGVVLAFAPDVTSGTVTTSTSSNVQYQNISDDSSYAEWLIPAWCTGTLDKVIYFPNGSSDGKFDLIRNRGGATTTVASNVTPSSSYQNPQAVTLSSTLIAGDYLRWKRHAGESAAAKVASMQIYDSAGSCTDATQHFIPETPAILGTSVWIAGSSSLDGAFQIAPHGSTLRFVGGAAHQGPEGTYGQEHPVTETWTKGGASWTPAGGMWTDLVVLTRSSTLYYTAGSPNVGSLETIYTFKSAALCVQNTLTTNGTVDLGSIYFSMLPGKSAAITTAGITLDGTVGNTQEISTNGAGSPSYFTGSLATSDALVTYLYETPLGGSLCLYNEALGSDTIADRDQEPKGSNGVKLYERIAPTTQSNVSGITHSGYGCLWLDSATGPTSYGRQ